MNNIEEPEIYSEWRKKAKIAEEDRKKRAIKLGLPEDIPLKVIEIVEKKGKINPALMEFYKELEEPWKNDVRRLGLPEDTPTEVVNAEKKRMEIIKLTNGELDENTSWKDIMPYFESKENLNGVVTAANWWITQLGLESQEPSNERQRVSPELINMFKATLISRMIQEIKLKGNINISYDYSPGMFLTEAYDLIGLRSTPKCPYKESMDVTFQEIAVNGEIIYSNSNHKKVDSNDSVKFDDKGKGKAR